MSVRKVQYIENAPLSMKIPSLHFNRQRKRPILTFFIITVKYWFRVLYVSTGSQSFFSPPKIQLITRADCIWFRVLYVVKGRSFRFQHRHHFFPHGIHNINFHTHNPNLVLASVSRTARSMYNMRKEIKVSMLKNANALQLLVFGCLFNCLP